jgi:L-ascorbate metabolism protein UlaG (beta-lactamase superfamily)
MNEEKRLKITRIVHCCVLLDFGGSVILTDPWFSEKFGYHPGESISIPVEALPQLAGMVVSHDHYDHNDMKSFGNYRSKGVPMICERGAVPAAQKAGFNNVRWLVPWETAHLGIVRVTAVPALHGVPEVGYILQALGYTVYFAGDTLFFPALSEIAQRFPSIDVALLPINGLKMFGKQVVMNPAEAAELCKLLRPRHAVPTHYAFTGGAIMDAVAMKYYDRQDRLTQIFREAVQLRAPETRVEILEPGKSLNLAGAAAVAENGFIKESVKSFHLGT